MRTRRRRAQAPGTQYPCRIVTADDPGQALNLSYLNVCLLATKVGPAPEAFVPDFGR